MCQELFQESIPPGLRLAAHCEMNALFPLSIPPSLQGFGKLGKSEPGRNRSRRCSRTFYTNRSRSRHCSRNLSRDRSWYGSDGGIGMPWVVMVVVVVVVVVVLGGGTGVGRIGNGAGRVTPNSGMGVSEELQRLLLLLLLLLLLFLVVWPAVAAGPSGDGGSMDAGIVAPIAGWGVREEPQRLLLLLLSILLWLVWPPRYFPHGGRKMPRVVVVGGGIGEIVVP